MRRRLLLLGVGGLLLLLILREPFHPFLVLYLDDLLSPKPDPLEFTLSDGVQVRLYEDTRPHIGKVASLQKGLVLVYKGREMIEEAYGFGLPIVVIAGTPHNARHATVMQVEEGVWVKTFSIDTADRPTEFLKVKYEDVEPIGTVVYTYTLSPPNEIAIEVDFTHLEASWERAYLMNEQGAVNFTLYEDPKGRWIDGTTVGIWEETKAPFGCWFAPETKISFCVNTEAGRRGFVGRERYNQYRWTGIFYLSWSGIDLEVLAPATHYSYTVRVENW